VNSLNDALDEECCCQCVDSWQCLRHWCSQVQN